MAILGLVPPEVPAPCCFVEGCPRPVVGIVALSDGSDSVLFCAVDLGRYRDVLRRLTGLREPAREVKRG
jgi:hypothetical protein